MQRDNSLGLGHKKISYGKMYRKKYKNNFNNKNFVRKNSKNDKKIFEKN